MRALWLIPALLGVAAAALMGLEQGGVCADWPGGGECRTGPVEANVTMPLVLAAVLTAVALVLVAWRRGRRAGRAVVVLALAALVVGSAELVAELAEEVLEG